MSTPCPENSVKRMPHETKPITWIGGIRISPFKVSEDDTMSPEVVFWFDTNTGATMTCEVAYSFAAYRCLWETLGDHLMTYHRSHGRFPDNIHVVDDYCAEQIRGIVPGSIQVERRPPLELNQRIRTFVQKLMVRSEGDSKGAAVHGLSKEHTERLMVNRVVFSDLVKSLADDDFDGQWGYAGEENVTVAPGLRDLLWGPASIPPSMDFTCSVFDGGELEEEDEGNPWLGEFVENGKLPERSVRGIFQARVIAIALWDFKMNQWGNVFEGWGVLEMEVFLDRFGNEVVFFSEDDVDFAIDTIASFFQWIVTTEHVRKNEARALLEKFHAGRECLRGKLMPDSSGDLIPFSPWPKEFCSELSVRPGESVAGAPMPTVRRSGPKIGRNDPCPCGSARKYKKCCVRGGTLAA